MFYSAFDIDTAILETISRTDKYKRYVTIAEFETLENQIVVDFNRLPKIPSIFGIRTRNDTTLFYFYTHL
jgi:hypothetical protein